MPQDNRVRNKQLTRREIETLELLARGYSSEEVSLLRGVSKRTIDFHSSNLFKKLEVNNRVQAIRAGARMGLIRFTPSKTVRRGVITKTEIFVLELLLEGRSSREIAEVRFVSKRTVDFHLAKLHDKLDCNNRVSLLRAAWYHDLINPLAAWEISA